MKKNLIIGILLGFFATFLMSHNVNASQSFIREINTNNTENWSFCPGRTSFVRTTNYSCSISSDFTRQFIPLNNILSGDVELNSGDRVIMYYSHTFKNNTANSNQRNLQTISGQGFPAWFDIENITIEEVGKEENFDQKSYLYIYTGRANQDITINSYQLSGAPFRFSAFSGQNFTYYYQGVFFYGEDADADFKNSITSYLGDISSDTSDIVDTLGEINDKLDSLDSNADKNEQGWSNMQNTDGLIDVGDNTSFMDTFNSINSFFGGIKNVSATDCSFDFSNDVVDLGVLNFCSMPEALRTIISPIAAIIFAVVDIFLAWGSVKYIVSVIDWARRN